MKKLRISIIVPVYNEADHIASCLRAIAAQTVRPYEVIVIDNNSTDTTALIAAQFPFVTVLHEPRQGVVHARNTGFNAAQGEIIGRIDGDTVIDTHWVETLERVFQDETLAAVTGKITYNDVAWAPLVNRIDLFFRRYFAWVLGREVALQGTNMGIRRTAWLDVRGSTCAKRGLHEDFDLAVHLNWRGHTKRFDEQLKATIGFRQTESGWFEFAQYAMQSPRTYARHGLKSQRHMYPVVFLTVVVFYVPLWMLHHGYDGKMQAFSWRTLLNATAVRRVNPATFVD
jgi:glycosyltransferase involved in cell wall biosynthesis